MTIASRRLVIQGALFAGACACGIAHAAFAADTPSPTGKYVCPPCGCASDGQDFDKPGGCPSCGMPLMAKPKPEAPKAHEGGGFVGVSAPRTREGWTAAKRT